MPYSENSTWFKSVVRIFRFVIVLFKFCHFVFFLVVLLIGIGSYCKGSIDVWATDDLLPLIPYEDTAHGSEEAAGTQVQDLENPTHSINVGLSSVSSNLNYITSNANFYRNSQSVIDRNEEYWRITASENQKAAYDQLEVISQIEPMTPMAMRESEGAAWCMTSTCSLSATII